MRFFSRKLIKPEDLNAHGTLFGGSVLAWIDEEAAIYVICQLGKGNIATKFMSEIDFVSSAKLGDIIEIGMETVNFGNTSITVKCEVRQKFTKETIIRIDKIVFVHLDENGRPIPHDVTEPVN
ncbi:MAG: acyl-CoA thioesterase [Balneolaceae bacterium]|nr:acyl-CoA thioesterase [Balneolaceae bacterium]MCH8547568.1 acyl-CoA thioesterase [Balneolaceae bacterium]